MIAATILLSGQPCGPGCLAHLSHPCHRCGRIAGNGEAAMCDACLLKVLDILFYEMDRMQGHA